MLLALNSPDTSRILKLIDRGDLGKIEQALEQNRRASCDYTACG